MNASQHRHRRVARLAAVAAASVMSALALMPGVANASPHDPPTPDKPCGVTQKDASTKYAHVVWILEENKSISQIIGSPDAPYINKLVGLCGEATNYTAISHPSLPNYIALTSGSLQGIADDDNPSAHPLNVDSIFSQLNGDWRGLDESMKTNCEQQNDGNYAVRHNPATYYVQQGFPAVCQKNDIPFAMDAHTPPDISAKFTFITPDTCDDMHTACAGNGTDGEIQAGDKYLSTLVPALINTPQYQSGNTVIFITSDEDDSSTTANKVLTQVIAPTVTPGTKANDAFSHYSLLRTTEDMFGLQPLGEAATAADMSDAFNL